MTKKPYVGITGFKTPEEVKLIGEQCINIPNGYTIMYGILVSETRMRDPMNSGKRSPAIKDLKSIIEGIPKESLAMLHYHQRNNFGFKDSLLEIVNQSNANSVQLNIAWPDPLEVLYLKENNITITFQLPSRAIKGMDEKEISNRLREYDSIIDYALVDLSGGRGFPFDVNRSNDLLNLVSESLPETNLVIAGGLNSNNLCSKLSLLNYSPISFDAESGLMKNNTLHLDLTRKYLEMVTMLK